MKTISNPLTIIGMFAGIAEVSGTIVLPFVSQELQHVFIWYVIGFPILLVISFFITLNFNTKALYAPSDFSNEDNFMKLAYKIKTIDTKIEEVKTSNPDLSDELGDLQIDLDEIIKRLSESEGVYLETKRKLDSMPTIHYGREGEPFPPGKDGDIFIQY